MTALRAAQTEADADVERQRSILSQEYASAIRKAQADNDLALAQALYEEAERKEAELRAQQEAAANLMAQAGDYTRVGTLYGLSDAEVAKLSGASNGSTGSAGGSGGKVQNWNNGSLDRAQVRELQNMINAIEGTNLVADGLYGNKSAGATGGLSVKDAYEKYVMNRYNTVLEKYLNLKAMGVPQSELNKQLTLWKEDGVLVGREAYDIKTHR